MKPNREILLKSILNYGILPGLKFFAACKLKRFSSLAIPSLPFGVNLRKGTSDLEVCYQIFLDNEYKTEYIRDPKVVIDGGANIGLFSVLIKSKYPAAKIICIEPDNDNFKILQSNVGNYNDVYCENFGLWYKNCGLKVYDKLYMGKWGLIVEEDEENPNVQAITLNEIVEKYNLTRIDVLKLDIESSEKYLFKDNFNKWLPITKVIMIELHDRFEAGCSRIFFEFINQHIPNYTLSASGENLIVVNNDL